MARKGEKKFDQRDTARLALKENESFTKMAEKRQTGAVLKDYGLNADVRLEWDLNKDAMQDRIFRITINGESALLDYEEFLHYSRLI